MIVDYGTILQYARIGTPGHVLVEAGLINIESGNPSGAHTLLATEALHRLFPGLAPGDLADVLAGLHDYVVAYAFDRSGFLDGSARNMDAVNRLRSLGACDSGLGQLRDLIVKAAAEAGKRLEQTRKMRR